MQKIELDNTENILGRKKMWVVRQPKDQPSAGIAGRNKLDCSLGPFMKVEQEQGVK